MQATFLFLVLQQLYLVGILQRLFLFLATYSTSKPSDDEEGSFSPSSTAPETRDGPLVTYHYSSLLLVVGFVLFLYRLFLRGHIRRAAFLIAF